MNNKGKMNILVLVAIVAVAIGAVIYFTGSLTPTPTAGAIANGYYDALTGECRSAQDRPNGVPYFADADEPTEFQCCFDLNKNQVDCNNPENGLYAILDTVTGQFWYQSVVKITNNGNVDLTGAWVDSATWTPSHALLTAAYADMIDAGVGQPLAKTASVEWSTELIDLQAIGLGGPNTYSLTLVTKATATGLPETPQSHTKSITVEQEGIQFDVDISYIAT